MSYETHDVLTWILTQAESVPTKIRKLALTAIMSDTANTRTIGSQSFSVESHNHLNELFDNGRRKIQMIKLVRTENGLALKEAKEFVEKHWDFV